MVSVLLLTFSAATAQVLDPPKSASDFSSTWILDRKATTDTTTRSRFDEVTLIISRNGPKLKVIYNGKRKGKTRVYELEYFTDGHGEENPSPLGGLSRRSKTFWSYGNLISEYIVTWSVSPTEYKQEATDIWELSKDLDMLIIRTEVREAHLIPEIFRIIVKPQKYKKVFRRVH